MSLSDVARAEPDPSITDVPAEPELPAHYDPLPNHHPATTQPWLPTAEDLAYMDGLTAAGHRPLVTDSGVRVELKDITAADFLKLAVDLATKGLLADHPEWTAGWRAHVVEAIEHLVAALDHAPA